MLARGAGWGDRGGGHGVPAADRGSALSRRPAGEGDGCRRWEPGVDCSAVAGLACRGGRLAGGQSGRAPGLAGGVESRGDGTGAGAAGLCRRFGAGDDHVFGGHHADLPGELSRARAGPAVCADDDDPHCYGRALQRPGWARPVRPYGPVPVVAGDLCGGVRVCRLLPGAVPFAAADRLGRHPPVSRDALRAAGPGVPWSTWRMRGTACGGAASC